MDLSTLGCRVIPPPRAFSRLARMPRPPRIPAVIGLLALAAVGLVACGGEDAKLLPGETAREIVANLDTVQQLSDEGDCIGAESAAVQVGEQIEALEGVDRKLKQALEDGAARLQEVIVECEESATEAIAPATIPQSEAEEKPEKEKEKEEKPKAEEEPEGNPSLPPQAKGEGKGLEKQPEPPPAEEAPQEPPAESPSGGVSPSNPAGGGE
jgi:hypothetical protein